MSLEVKGEGAECIGSLSSCLVEGDAEQRAGAKRVRRRALTLSLVLQAMALAALLLVPLFGKADRIVRAAWVPQSIFTRGGGGSPVEQRSHQPPRPKPFIFHRGDFLYPPRPTPPGSAPVVRKEPVEGGANPMLPPGTGDGSGEIPGAIPIPGEGARREPPPPTTRGNAPPRIVRTRLEPAMLIHRVEPVFPPILRHIRRGARVELRAVIATDGTIQSLQFVGGDPLCYPSATDAVRQWRYRPTVLNGVPVEVETYITVIYTLQ